MLPESTNSAFVHLGFRQSSLGMQKQLPVTGWEKINYRTFAVRSTTPVKEAYFVFLLTAILLQRVALRGLCLTLSQKHLLQLQGPLGKKSLLSKQRIGGLTFSNKISGRWSPHDKRQGAAEMREISTVLTPKYCRRRYR